MKEWQKIETSLQSAKDATDKKKLSITARKHIEKAEITELEEIRGAARDEFFKELAEIELWWKEFEKKPENLVQVIQFSSNENKIEKAITELGNIQYWGAVDILLTLLNNERFRDSAALALREMPTQKSLNPIIEAIQRNPNGAECLLYALQVLDCSEVAEHLVELFIAKPKALVVRFDIYECFSKATKRLLPHTKTACCAKLLMAMKESDNQCDIKELRQLYELILEIQE